MSETPEKKKARLRYDNVFKTAWTDEFHFIKHSRKGNKFAFCEFCRTATEPFCVLLNFFFIFSWFYLDVVLQNFILNTVSDWLNDKELTNGSFRYKLRGKRLRKGPK
jgi:hypothetical protein